MPTTPLEYVETAETMLDAVRSYEECLDSEMDYPGENTVEEDFESACDSLERQLRIAIGKLDDEDDGPD